MMMLCSAMAGEALTPAHSTPAMTPPQNKTPLVIPGFQECMGSHPWSKIIGGSPMLFLRYRQLRYDFGGQPLKLHTVYQFIQTSQIDIFMQKHTTCLDYLHQKCVFLHSQEGGGRIAVA